MIKTARVFAAAVLSMFFCLVPAEQLNAAEEYQRESIAIDWEKDQFDMYRYTDSYFREYEYYFIDYTAKENPGQSAWKTQIITITYVDPAYVAIHEVHNYFMISYYFSHEKIVHHANQEDYSTSPYQKIGGDLQYIRRFNAMLAKIRLILAGQGEYSSGERRQQDIFYLDSARRFMY
ncbi:MAG: hypothetical protein LBI94_07630 [Treponema sp.]|jgi:hypothetical protein|nr:hypothetical protein [Treponema sp.]